MVSHNTQLHIDPHKYVVVKCLQTLVQISKNGSKRSLEYFVAFEREETNV